MDKTTKFLLGLCILAFAAVLWLMIAGTIQRNANLKYSCEVTQAAISKYPVKYEKPYCYVELLPGVWAEYYSIKIEKGE
jgi:hypothetical protein